MQARLQHILTFRTTHFSWTVARWRSDAHFQTGGVVSVLCNKGQPVFAALHLLSAQSAAPHLKGSLRAF